MISDNEREEESEEEGSYYKKVTKIICINGIFISSSLKSLDIRQSSVIMPISIINTLGGLEVLMTTSPIITRDKQKAITEMINLPRLKTLVYFDPTVTNGSATVYTTTASADNMLEVCKAHPTITRLATKYITGNLRDYLPTLDTLYAYDVNVRTTLPDSLRVLVSHLKVRETMVMSAPRPRLDIFIGNQEPAEVLRLFPSVSTIIVPQTRMREAIYNPTDDAIRTGAFRLSRIVADFPINPDLIPTMCPIEYYGYDVSIHQLRRGMIFLPRIEWFDFDNYLSVDSVFGR